MLSQASVAIIVTNVVLSTVAIVGVVLRLVSRRVKRQRLSGDDYLICAGLIVVLCGTGGYISASVVGGIGHHQQDLDPETMILFLKYTYALQFPYVTSVTLIKLSILLFYRRIFPTPRFKIATTVVCIFVIAWFITFFLATLLQQLPIENNWLKGPLAIPGGRAINVYVMYLTASVLEIMLDVVTLTMPLFVIWRLHMKPGQKLLLSGIFLLGAFVCVASMVRLYNLVVLLNPAIPASGDFTYSLSNIVLWSSLEPCFGVICACLPTLGPVLNRRSLQALVMSLRTMFTLGSRSSRSADASLDTQFRRERGRENAGIFYPLDDEHRLVTGVQADEDRGLDKDHVPLERIRVDKSFNIEVGNKH